jgi:SAM-dependent methyltransferase
MQWVASEAAKLAEGTRVLDIGAGSCRYRRYFDHCDYKSHDFAKLESCYGDLDYISDVLDIPVQDGSFDCVICTEVLEHVPEPIKVVKEFGRIVRPGGKLILTAPLGSGIHQAPYHFYGGYSPYWYEMFLAEAGFEDIVIEANGGFFKLFGQENQRFAEFLFRRSIKTKWLRIVLLPILVLVKLLWGVLMPLWCFLLDRIDTEPDFTVGYHVTANKTT